MQQNMRLYQDYNISENKHVISTGNRQTRGSKYNISELFPTF